MEILLVVTVGALCIGCFLVGAKVGQMVVKGDDVKLPSVNPFEAYRKHEAKKEAEIAMNKYDTIMQNIERYDGTGKGQEDVG